MTDHPSTLKGFAVGDTVRVVNPPKHREYLYRWKGSIGTVERIHPPSEGTYRISVRFGPPRSDTWTFSPENLQRGQVEWVPEEESE